jgi:hypothetical protein
VGIYTRYVADDYETAGSLQKYGFWGSQLYWRENWSGRYAYFVIVNAFQSLGVQAAPFLALIFICLWLVSLSWLLKQFLDADHQPRSGYLAVLGSAVILVATLRSMDHIHQILFWVTGILTYVNYLVCLLLSSAYYVYRLRNPISLRKRWWEIALFGVCAWIAAGLSEMGMVLQLTLYGTGFLVLLVNREILRRGSVFGLSGVGVAATLIGFGLMVSAPGNAVRAATVPPRPGLASVILQSNVLAVRFILNWVWRDTILAGISFLTPLLAGFAHCRSNLAVERGSPKEKRDFYILLFSIPAAYLLLWSQFAAGYFTLSGLPPDRALVIPQFLMVLGFALWGFQTGKMLRNLVRESQLLPRGLVLVGGTLLGLMLASGPGYASSRIYTMIAPARALAIEWDMRDQFIRQAIAERQRDIVVWYIQDLNRLGDYSSDPNFLVNRAAADYYGIDSIIALDEKPSGLRWKDKFYRHGRLRLPRASSNL